MPRKDLNVGFNDLQTEVQSYYGEDHTKIKLMVTPEQQCKEINLLKETLGNERFFFVVDLLNFQIREVNGIQKWLGYSEKEFSLNDYWNKLVHPGQRQSLLVIARQMYEVLCQGTYPLQFMVQRFASLIPLKHYNGHYILTKKTSSTFQYDQKNRLTGYLNEFTIIGDYDGEALSPRMFNSFGGKETAREKVIMDKAVDNFLKMKVFTVSELQTIRKLAYHPGITQAKIAKELGLTINTIDTYYKRFLHKARSFFNIEFSTAFDAAVYLRKEGLL